MTAHQCLFAECHSLIEDLPELIHVSTGGACNIHQIDGDNALIKSSVILRFIILIHIRREEGTTAHAWIAVALTVLVNLELKHLLLGNIIRHHSLCGTLCGKLCQIPVLTALSDIVFLQHVDQLRECRCDIYTLLIFDAENTLS